MVTVEHPFLDQSIRTWLRTNHRSRTLQRRVADIERVIHRWASASVVRDEQIQSNCARLSALERAVATCASQEPAGTVDELCEEAVEAITALRSARMQL